MTKRKKTSKKVVTEQGQRKLRKSNIADGKFSDTLNGQIQKHLVEGKTDAQIKALLKKKFPEIEDPKRKNYINWCRWYLNKKGALGHAS